MPSESKSIKPTSVDLPTGSEIDSDNKSSEQENSRGKLHSFKLMSLNIDSLLKHIDEFRVFIDQEKPHIVSLNETKLDQSICDSSLEIANYDIIRNDRNRFGGGVALYVNKNLSYKVITDLMVDKLESVSVQIKNGSFKPFIVTSIYRPPEKPVSYFSYIECLIASLESENKESIVMGGRPFSAS